MGPVCVFFASLFIEVTELTKINSLYFIFYIYVCTVHLVYSFYFKQYSIYIYYFNNIYIIITPTCFDTFVSSLGSFENHIDYILSTTTA